MNPFTVYSVGDGLFMKRVLEAIAMLNNDGVLHSLGTIGLLCAILLVGFRGVSEGRGPDIASLLGGLILFLCMFGATATVIIEDIGLAPGEIQENTYTVANVPYGVAFMGSMMSSIGVKLTEKMEQAYGFSTSTASIRDVGFGRSLEWLAAIRYARTSAGTSNPTFERFRTNLVQYMRFCSAQAILRDPGRVATMMNATDPLATTAFGFDNPWVTTPWQTGGTVSDVSCDVALERLRTYSDSDDLMSDFAEGVAGPMGYSGTTSAYSQAQDAFQTLNVGLTQAQRYILGTVMNASWRSASANIPYIGDQQAIQIAMMMQASEQQATQFAGEETMFRRMMRPIMAFLESMVYAAAPFMAMVAGLGRIGLSMVGRYALITLWVTLWMPTLAIINMFQITMADRAIHSVLNPAGGGNAFQIGSLSGSGYVENAVIDWIGTGALLAASTPMITLMILFGSAMTAVGLANQLKGGDHINEKVPSPDAAQNSPAMQHQAIFDSSHVKGVTEKDAPLPTFDFSQTAQTVASSRASELAASSQRWTAGTGKEVSQAISHDLASGVGIDNRGEVKLTQSEGRAIEASRMEGVDYSVGGSAASRMILGVAASQEAGARLDLGKASKAIAGMLGKAVEKMGSKDGQKYLEQLGDSLGIGGGGSIRAEDRIERIADQMAKVADNLNAAMKSSDSVRGEIANASSQIISQNARETGTQSAKVANSATFKKDSEDLQQKQNAYEEASSLASSSAIGQRMDLGHITKKMMDSGADSRYEGQAMALSSNDTFGRVAKAVEESGFFGSMKTNGRQIRAAAAFMILNNHVPPSAGVNLNEGLSKDDARIANAQRAEAGLSLLSDTGLLLTSARGAGSGAVPAFNSNEGVAGSVVAGAATDMVESAKPGVPNGTESQAKSAASAMFTEQGQRRSSINIAPTVGVNPSEVEDGVKNATANKENHGYGKFSSVDRGAENLNDKHQDNAREVKAGQDVVDANAAHIESRNEAVSAAGEGLAGIGFGGALRAIRGMPAKDGVTDNFLNWEAVGMGSAPKPPATSHNVEFGQMVQDAMNGQYTNGRKLPFASAVVMAGIQAENSPSGLSSEQRQVVAEAYESLSDDGKVAAENIDAKSQWGVNRPEVLPQGSVAELANAGKESTFKYKEMPDAAKINHLVGYEQDEGNHVPQSVFRKD